GRECVGLVGGAAVSAILRSRAAWSQDDRRMRRLGWLIARAETDPLEQAGRTVLREGRRRQVSAYKLSRCRLAMRSTLCARSTRSRLRRIAAFLCCHPRTPPPLARRSSRWRHNTGCPRSTPVGPTSPRAGFWHTQQISLIGIAGPHLTSTASCAAPR